ncbi:2-amino-4-hydroxy-6-hydroxymethyldihydropteridine pyrophosphokinase [Caenibius tardaugens NBRC 16725]|uniref:2-amino-4-hydroxy-6-hydroxymethyldihydropteridine pyrophosphokinase n=1 Tax=Caenibius tardaugens NBRC 16725 TaxID=1219035 RepID=U2YPG2_9SPHN|nr:2-amino-4-hydroxy-6-hydroxymethyldihydropteridine diphosphokinase [Caenibius tardaugens]AZI36390.1 2-amino-4-hydroxy-6-hydroxymethyldihydropteridine diphosphokinase [Caenibius tardaugens NBRC 16725]GAD50800.1 2-amino-4-hydroxy-6-hydroxymethyldihydropteridine pyrophosphokinase [Caenibius tardaugens NBRC 16725]
MGAHLYLVALGSNVRHPRYGAPRAVLRAAFAALDRGPLQLVRAARVIETAPLGPSRRRYANAVALVRSDCTPPEMLHELHRIEAAFGRRRMGARWGARVLDLDIVLWDGGAYAVSGLTIPHAAFRQRDFVLGPARQIAGDWRDPISGLTIYQLFARLTRNRPLPRAATWSGP